MARKIGISVGDHIYKKVVELVRRGDFSTPSEVAKTALIEWLKEKEDIMAPGRSIGEHVRDEILFVLYLKKRATKEEINKELAKKGLEQEPEQLRAHLFLLEEAGKIVEKQGKYVIKEV
jgi:Arc/MetJ-type ribon-helix-helix transcriptional regulator